MWADGEFQQRNGNRERQMETNGNSVWENKIFDSS